MPTFSLTVNGEARTVDATPDMPLLWALRDLLQITGPKYGCGEGICGACTVLVDGKAVRSCITPLTLIDGAQVTTIEGLSEDGDHPLQQAWMAEDVPQCGYCQAGQIMTAAAMLSETPRPDDEQIDAVMSEHVCRCGTYQRIRAAIHRAAAEVTR